MFLNNRDRCSQRVGGGYDVNRLCGCMGDGWGNVARVCGHRQEGMVAG